MHWLRATDSPCRLLAFAWRPGTGESPPVEHVARRDRGPFSPAKGRRTCSCPQRQGGPLAPRRSVAGSSPARFAEDLLDYIDTRRLQLIGYYRKPQAHLQLEKYAPRN